MEFTDEASNAEIACDATLHYLWCQFSQQCYNKDGLAKMVMSALLGKNNGEDVDSSDLVVDVGPDVMRMSSFKGRPCLRT